MSTMEQNNIENQVCDAISILVDEGVNSAGYDKTISALVVECVDSLKGQYKIKYQDAYYYATSDNTEVEYSKNTQVYILIPGNDFSKEKKIVGTVKDLGDTYISSWDESNQYVVVGRNCAELLAPQELCSYKSGEYKLEELILYKDGASNNKLKLEKDELAKYLVDSEKLRIGATFKTALADEQRQRGSYGISIKAEFNDADNTGQIISKTFNLTTDNMVGMPYDFGIPTAQYLDFDINGKNFIKITQVALLIADFPVAEKEGEDYPNDIFISDFIIEGIAPPDAKVFTTYYLDIKSSVGKYLTETDSKTTLEAVLSLKNKTVTSSSLEYYWFIEDASVVTTSDLYCVYGGQGWRCLNEQKTITEEITKPNGETETQERKEWVPGVAIREVSRGDIPNIKSIYKCICIYNSGKSSIAAEIELENTNPDYKFIMESTNGTEFILDRGKTTLKFLDNKITSGDKTPSTSLTYHWAKEDSSGGYHYLGSDHTGNGGELPVCSQFDNSTLMNHLRQLQENYDIYLGNQLVTTKSVYSEYSTFDAEKEEDRSVLKTGFDNSEAGKAKGIIVNLINVLGLNSPTNQELADAIQPYLDSISITYIDESTFYDVPARSILNYNVFKCTAMNGDTVLGTARIKLTNQHVSNDNGYVVIENGNQTFKYSAEGVAPTDKNNKNPLTLKPLTFKLYDEKGTEVTGIKDADITWYYPLENTLIKGDDGDEKSADGLWGIRHGQTFVFDIESRFKYEASNNVIKIEVKHQDRILKQDTSFSFIKDGMSGTNGTDYFCRIVPKYDLDNAYPTIIWNKKKQGSPVYLNKQENLLTDGDQWFTVEFWNGSELISKDLTVDFKLLFPAATIGSAYFSLIKIENNKFYFDKTQENLDKLAQLDILEKNGTTPSTESLSDKYKYGLLNIVRAEVSYQGKKYYAELPVAMAILENTDDSEYGIYIKPGTGYNEVVYAADGARPQYASAYPFEVQVIKFEDEGDIELSTTFNNEKYGTTLKYNWTNNLGRYRALKYNGSNNKFLKREYVKDSEGKNINTGRQRVITPSSYYNGSATDLGIKCIVTKNNGDPIGTLYFPIHFMLNKFGYSALNDWDGTSVEINEKDGYILSPQVGAGKKDTNNRFTGVLMGEMKSGHEANSDIGLLGFSAGERTIFLDADTGKAEFGRAGAGQIIIDPGDPTNEREGQDAIIRGGSYSTTDKTGMEINFGTDPYIKYGSGNFEVNPQGILTARGADVRGPISSSSVNLYDNGYSDFEQIPAIQTVEKNDGTTSTLNEIYYKYQLKNAKDADIWDKVIWDENNPNSKTTHRAHSGLRSLKLKNGFTAEENKNAYVVLGSKNRNYGKTKVTQVASTSEKRYIISAYARTGTEGVTKATLSIGVGEAKNRTDDVLDFSRDKGKIFGTDEVTTSWKRFSFEYLSDATGPEGDGAFGSSYYIALRFTNRTPGATIFIDDIQIEESYAGLKPSDYHPTGTTKIDGGSVYTETITALGRVTAGEFYIGNSSNGTLFQVNSNGYLYAQGAKFEGHIESGSGKIANWEIGTNDLKSQSTVNAEGKNYKPWTRIGNAYYENVIVVGAKELNNTEVPKAPFRVTRDGVLHATGANITGSITATSGTIGGCSIDSNGNLKVPAANITGTLTIGQLPGDVAQEGDIPTEAEITTITNNTIKTTNVTATNLKLSGSINLGSGAFTVSNAGVVTATSGTIGGWTLSSNYLRSLTNDSGKAVSSSSNATSWIQFVSYKTGDIENAIYIGQKVSGSWKDRFTVDWEGNVTFAGKLSGANGEFKGDLTASTTEFTKLSAGNGSLTVNKDQINIGTGSLIIDKDKLRVNPGESWGKIWIGDPNTPDWKEISIFPYGSVDDDGKPKPYTVDSKTSPVGNVGTTNFPFDQFVVRACLQTSERELKTDIQNYNINQAYDELKDLPIYTFKYNNADGSQNIKLNLGTIIDYIPSEAMHLNKADENRAYSVNNLLFWDIAATQVIQQKLEETIQEKETLQNRLDILEQKFLEMEEKLNGFN